jgi:chromosomal replication initiation ATPase DnaA
MNQDHLAIFVQFHKAIRNRVSTNTYETWFKEVRLKDVEGNTFILHVPSSVFIQVLTRTYGAMIAATLEEIGHPEVKFKFEVGDKDVPEQS